MTDPQLTRIPIPKTGMLIRKPVEWHEALSAQLAEAMSSATGRNI
ncbi:hypothetical protein [Rhizobium sp. YS-1r]|nr:hypothetical protein [Rhizobium sp. YS-1r]